MRAGHHDAASDVASARPTVAATIHHGTFDGSISCPAAASIAPLERCPRAEPDDDAEDRGHHADGSAVGEHHELDAARRCADRREHPELPLPTLRDHRECCPGDQAHEQHGERGRDEHHECGGPEFAVMTFRHAEVPVRVTLKELVEPAVVGADQEHDVVEAVGGVGCVERELVVEVERVPDDADNRGGAVAEFDGVARSRRRTSTPARR